MGTRGEHMRTIVGAALALMLGLAAPVLAQDQEWTDFMSIEDGFTTNFPGKPILENTTYRSQFGADLPARVYRANAGPARYSLTVVDYRPIEQILAEKAKNCP